jgi:GTPase SAR1 family protein
MRLMPGALLYCPYCYGTFREQEIQFRCSGRISRQGRRCEPQIDRLLRDRTGFSGAVPPVFAVNGRMTSAQCPQCGAESTTRVCPACHTQLPVHFGKVRSRMIALVGAKESGKTVFMTVLVHELMHRVGEQLGAAISGADDSTRHRFASEYEQPLYREARLLAPTTTAGTRDQAPLVFRFTTDSRGPFGLNGRLGGFGASGPQHTLLSFFDTAGEDLRSQQSVEQNVRYLAAADGILLLLDPLQMRGARQLAAPDTRLPTRGAADDEPAVVLENITDLILAKEGRKPSERIAKPLAVVFTKMDALLHDLKQTSSLLRPSQQTPYFDERDSLEVHTEIQRLLARWEGSRIDQIARLHYSRYRYFGVSALGETPTQANQVAPRGIRPIRVTSPFMWLLAEFRTIPLKRG